MTKRWTITLALAALCGAVAVPMPSAAQDENAADDIDKAIESGGTRRKRKKRSVNPLAWMHRKAGVRDTPSRGRMQGTRRSSFRLDAPEDGES